MPRDWLRTADVVARALRHRLTGGIHGAPRPEARNVLFFAPEAAVHPHFLTELLLAHGLEESGWRPVFAHCDAVLDFCPVMQMGKLPYDASAWNRAKTCAACVGHSQRGYAHFGVEDGVLPMGEALAADRGLIRSIAARALGPDFAHDGVPFGRIAQVDMLFYRKRMTLDFRDPVLARGLRVSILAAVRAYLATLRLIDATRARAVVHYNDYAIMLAATFAARRRGIPAITLTHPGHHGVDRRRVMVMRDNWNIANDGMIAAWPAARDLPVPEASVAEIFADLESRLAASSLHTYSPRSTGADPRARLGLSPGKPLVVAYTSSPDERVAAEKMLATVDYRWRADFGPFADQVDWLRRLAAHFTTRPHLQCAIRVHPREGANRRDGLPSEHLGLLRAGLVDLPANVVVVWPEDPVSSYDLAKHAAVALTSWSSVAVEFARMGMKVLSTARDFTYPVGDFAAFAATAPEYFAALDALVERAPSLSSVVHAVRWYHLSMLAPCLDVSDVLPENRLEDLPPRAVPRATAEFAAILGGGPLPLDRDLDRRRALGADAVAGERDAVRAHLARFAARVESAGGACAMTRAIREILAA